MGINQNSPLINITDGVVLINNQNTTIGYCRFTPSGDIEYIYVNLAYRRQGYSSIFINEVKKSSVKLVRFKTLFHRLVHNFLKV